MDYNKKIDELEAERAELKAELKTKGISEQKKHDIRQQISDYTKEIIMWGNKKPEPQNALGCIPNSLFIMAGCDATNPHGL